MSQKFGEKIRLLRTKKKATLEELADAIGSSKAYVWQLENKKNAKPSAEILFKISNFFNESPEFFLDDSVDQPTDKQLEDAFFRKFQKLSSSDKQTIGKIMSGFDDEQ